MRFHWTSSSPQRKCASHVTAVVPFENGATTRTQLETSSGTPTRPPSLAHMDAIASIRDDKVTHGVVFAPLVYAALWLVVLVTHAGIALAYAQESVIYVQTIGNIRMNSYLQHFGVGDRLRLDVAYSMIGTSSMVALWHVVACSRALVRSVQTRRLVFGLPWKPLYAPQTRGASANAVRQTESLGARLTRAFYFVYALGGVRSKFFDVAFIAREAIDLASQSYQAYRICASVAHPLIQNIAVAALVLGCWSTPVLRYVLRQNEPTKRLLCLTLDVVFDLCFTIVIPFLIFFFWSSLTKGTFSDPVLVVTNGAVLGQVLVNSWPAYVASRFPALSTLVVLESIKSLIKGRRSPLHQQQQQHHPEHDLMKRSSKFAALFSRRSVVPTSAPRLLQSERFQTMIYMAEQSTKVAHVDFVFLVFGVAVLVMYIAAAVTTRPGHHALGCKLQMRPWLALEYPCAVYEVNCAVRGLSGARDEVDAALRDVSASHIRALVFAHCQALEVPPRIQTLSSLLMLVVFNSTIVEWRESAALTASAHRHLAILLFVRVNWTEVFPPGLVSPEFPPTVVDFRVHASNVTHLPDAAIAVRWPRTFQNFVVEHSQLTRVPQSLAAMRVEGTVSFAGNAITRVALHDLLVTSCNKTYIGHNPLTQLDDETSGHDLDALTRAISELHVEHTLLTTLPQWMAMPLNASTTTGPTVSRQRSIDVFGCASPLCASPSAQSSSSSSSATEWHAVYSRDGTTVARLDCDAPSALGYYESLDALTQILSR